MYDGFLPTTKKEMDELGIEQFDFIYITGDAYVDHPSFGAAIVTRLIESMGFTVGIIIEGHYVLAEQNKTTKYEHIIPALVAIEQDRSVEGLLIILNTVGGDVEAGLALAELIAGMKTPTVSLVVGGGHSIGVPLAVSAKRSFIVPTASMTIHPVRMNGTVLGVPQTLSYFDKMQDRIVRFVTQNSRITEKDFRTLLMNTEELVLDVGSVVEGEKAVELGLIDSIGSLGEAMDCLYNMIENTEKRYAD